MICVSGFLITLVACFISGPEGPSTNCEMDVG